MILKKNLSENKTILDGLLPIGKSGDLLFRYFNFGGRCAMLYYIDGFLNDVCMERMVDRLYRITPEEIEKTQDLSDFVHKFITYTEVDVYQQTDDVVTELMSGKSVFLVDGLAGAIVIDLRDYPARGVEEPEKERVMRGSRDGFVETLIFNTALIRRRLRDPKLIVELVKVGERSKTDVAIVYVEDLVKQEELAIIREKIKNTKVSSLTLNMQSLTECFIKKNWYNPFPKVRFTERPDSATAAILEGNIIVLVDNAPQAMILPTSIMDFMEEPNDYYYPPLIGSYLRVVRNLVFIATFLLSPLWILALEYMDKLPEALGFLQV
ncbi:MAG: spore germination protein, partial [Clostridia bacterium]|nr:spore germination protein [Clostridia bacterium]